jgi:hypothetical protein
VGEPRDRLGHVDREAALAHGVESPADLAGRERDGRGHPRLDEPRRDGVDRDAVHQHVPEGVDEADHADDPTVLMVDLLRRELLGDSSGGHEVDGQDGVPPVPVHGGEPLVPSDPSVVDDGVHAPVGLDEVLGDPLRCVPGGDVEGQVVARVWGDAASLADAGGVRPG